jgi:single stranded DNA-binding protein
MHYANSVFLAGNLLTTPDLRQLPGGRDVANAQLAIVSHFLVNNGNEVAERTTTLNLAFFGHAAKQAMQLNAGDNIQIEGSIETRSVSNTAKRNVTEIIVRRCAIVNEIVTPKE